MPWPTLITNRTAADLTEVRRVKDKINSSGWASLTTAEQAAWVAGMKGSYGPIDWNRVGEAVQYLVDELTSYGYPVMVMPKTDWAINAIPEPEQMVEYLSNVQTLIDAYYIKTTTPELPETMDGPTVSRVNAIEQILTDIKGLIENMIQSFKKAGTFKAGQGVIL